MSEALRKITSTKKRDVAFRKKEHPLESWISTVTPSDRSLKNALKQPGTHYIMEIKKASPSQGLIRADFDPVAIARLYAKYAVAISVLADGPYFQGSLDDVRAVRNATTPPVLCKDFMLEPYQVAEARHYGADAVLLMLSVLDDVAYAACASEARKWKLDILTEVHTPAEMERALQLDAKIIGINNRNLRDLSVDLSTTEELAARVPKDSIVVSESGIQSRQDVLRLRKHANGFLVGTHLMRQENMEKAVKELVFGPIKICGLTNVTDASLAKDHGASYGGFVFAEGSPRKISLEKAVELTRAVDLDWAGVFVNASVKTVADAALALSLFAVQLHGDEDEAYRVELRKHLPARVRIWQALRVNDINDVGEIAGADKILLDSRSAVVYGGTGKQFDWRGLDRLPDKSRIILAGGIGPDNILEADALGMFCLDLSSAVESAPGKKDASKLAALFEKLRRKGRFDD